jgi:hypothetical protein
MLRNSTAEALMAWPAPKDNANTALPVLAGVHVTPANGPEFQVMLHQVRPDIVVFDRLSTEGTSCMLFIR